MRLLKKTLLPVWCCAFLTICSRTARQDSALSESTPVQDTTISVSAPAKSDTVVIEPEISALDVKQAQVAPEILEAARPVYSMSMIENNVSGTVRLRILVGTDGLIKQYIILNDLGYGTNEAIHAALIRMKFTPARKDTTRVAVWIDTTLNFTKPAIRY